jgi:hypothetical protein
MPLMIGCQSKWESFARNWNFGKRVLIRKLNELLKNM